MKILYLTVANQDVNLLPNYMKSDYMSDLLFHGFRSLYGSDVVDVPKKEFMYKNYDGDLSQFWGRGFTYSKTLDDIDVDRTDINKKLYKFFDLIVLSVHHSCHPHGGNLINILNEISGNTKAKIIVVDGHDTTSTYEFALQYTPYLFKREIDFDRTDLIPISFAIPKEKIIDNVPEKNKGMADIVPADHTHPNRKTHVFTTEEEYYREYQRSYFAITVKKGGWDCERHYEILANGCIPIFGDIERCPKYTLTSLPKKSFSKIKDSNCLQLNKKIFDKNDIILNHEYVLTEDLDKNACGIYIHELLQYTRHHLTTEALAKYVLECVK